MKVPLPNKFKTILSKGVTPCKQVNIINIVFINVNIVYILVININPVVHSKKKMHKNENLVTR